MSDLLALAMAGLIGIGAVLLIIYTTHTMTTRSCHPRLVEYSDVLDGQRWQAVCAGCQWEGPPRSYKPMARKEGTQ